MNQLRKLETTEYADVLRNRFGGKAIVGVFDSMQELLDVTLDSKGWTAACSYWNKHSAEWYGLSSEFPGVDPRVEEVAKLIAKGWTRGADRLVAALGGLSDIQVKPISIKRVRRWAEQGDVIDMPRVYAGRLDVAWQQCHRAQKVGPQKITIVCDAIESGSNDADTMFWRGAAVVALADKLQSAGYNVEVVSAWTGTNDGKKVVCHVTVKQSDQPLDITTLASAVACPAFFRCIGHCWGNRVEERKYGGGYSVDSWTPAAGEIMASPGRRGSWNAVSAREWVEQQIKNLEEEKEKVA